MAQLPPVIRPIQHSGAGLWAGIPQGAEFGRYHSLVVEGLDERLVSARSAAGVVQALDVQAVTGRPAWAVQFHPESAGGPLDTIEMFTDFIAECRAVKLEAGISTRGDVMGAAKVEPAFTQPQPQPIAATA